MQVSIQSFTHLGAILSLVVLELMIPFLYLCIDLVRELDLSDDLFIFLISIGTNIYLKRLLMVFDFFGDVRI